MTLFDGPRVLFLHRVQLCGIQRDGFSEDADGGEKVAVKTPFSREMRDVGTFVNSLKAGCH